MKVICKQCQGNKTYRGMGSMIVKCDACKGIGLVEPKAEAKAEPVKAKTAKKVIKGKSDAKETGQGKESSN